MTPEETTMISLAQELSDPGGKQAPARGHPGGAKLEVLANATAPARRLPAKTDPGDYYERARLQHSLARDRIREAKERGADVAEIRKLEEEADRAAYVGD